MYGINYQLTVYMLAVLGVSYLTRTGANDHVPTHARDSHVDFLNL